MQRVARDNSDDIVDVGMVRDGPDHRLVCFDVVLCFDLLEIAAQDIRSLSLVERREKLCDVLIQIEDDTLRFSEEFTDPDKLLAAADQDGP